MSTSIRTSSLPKLLQGLVLTGGILAAAASTAADRVAIHFADLGNIRNWYSNSTEELYVENLRGNWYRITFWSPCQELPFAIGIAFVTDGLGDLDKYSSILVGGERCYFRTFEESAAPAARADTNKEEDAP
jgi:hypothetical protein